MQTVLLGVITWTTGDIYVSLNSPTMQNFANKTALGIPTSALVMLAICGGGALFMRYAVPGRNLHAVGRNPAASRLAGINDGFYVVLALVITGLLVGLAAAVLTAQLGGGHPEVESGYLLPAFAAAFLGAAVSRTGTASFLGALYGSAAPPVRNQRTGCRQRGSVEPKRCSGADPHRRRCRFNGRSVEVHAGLTVMTPSG